MGIRLALVGILALGVGGCAALAGVDHFSEGPCAGGTSGGICVCWDYVGSNVGHVYSSGSSTCYCPGSTAPSWN